MTVSTRPNVLWISTHDINPHLGCYAGIYPGAEQAVTPHLDRLASQGMRFDRAYATAPVCAPARSSIMTGSFPTSIGTMHMRSRAVPPAQVQLLPEMLRAEGYYTSNTQFTDFQMPTPRSAFDSWGESAHWRDREDPDQPFFAMFHGMITHESQIYLPDDEFEAATSHVRPEGRHDPDAVALPPYHPDTAVFRRSWARYLDLVTEMDQWVGRLLQDLEDDGLAEDTIVAFWSDHGLGMPRGKRWVTEAGLHEPLIIRWPGVTSPGSTHTGLVHVMDLAPTMLRACGASIPDWMQAVPLVDEEMQWIPQPNTHLFASRDRMDEQQDTSRTVRDDRFRYTRHLHPDRSPMQHCRYPDALATWDDLRRLQFEEASALGLGEARALLTPAQRDVASPCKPAEELFDLHEDPHELHNLVGSSEHAAALDGLRAALDSWTTTYGDLGLLDEEELVESWRPDGVWPRTAAPTALRSEESVQVSCPDDSRVVWTEDPPCPNPSAEASHELGRFAVMDGGDLPDGRRWHLHSPAAPIPADRPIWLQACRLGHRSSPEVVTAPEG